MRKIISAATLLLAGAAWAQQDADAWVMNGAAADHISSAVVDANGSSYIGGSNDAAGQNTAVFVIKYDLNGNQVWRYDYSIAGRLLTPGRIAVSGAGTVFFGFNNYIGSSPITNGFQSTLALTSAGALKFVKHYQRAGSSKTQTRLAWNIAAVGETGCASFVLEPDAVTGNLFPVCLRYSNAGTLTSEVAHSTIFAFSAGSMVPTVRFAGDRWLMAYGPGGVSPQTTILALDASDALSFSLPFRTDGPNRVNDFLGAADGGFYAAGASQVGTAGQAACLQRYAALGDLRWASAPSSADESMALAPWLSTDLQVLSKKSNNGTAIQQISQFASPGQYWSYTGLLPRFVSTLGSMVMFAAKPSGPPYSSATKALYNYLAPNTMTTGPTFGTAADPESGVAGGLGPIHQYTLVMTTTNQNYRLRARRFAPKPVADSTYTAVNTPVTGNVLANDLLCSGLTPVLTAQPTHGSLVLQANGDFTYTPDSGYRGTDSFTYKAVRGPLSNSVACTISVQQASFPAAFQTPGTAVLGQSGSYRVYLHGTSTSSRTVSLSSNCLSVPASVTVPAGKNFANFTAVCTQASNNSLIDKLTATCSGGSKTTGINATKFAVLGLSVSPTTIADSGTAVGTVQTPNASGISVNLAADVDWLGIPPAVATASGSAQFNIAPTKVLTHTVVATIQATCGISTRTTTLTVNP